MDKQKLIKKVEKRALEFRSRGLPSPTDGKRHDLIKSDERKWIGMAHDELDWSFAKIGSVFDRDARTVKVSVEEERKKKERHPERVLIHQQQKEHIKLLQQMARSALDHLPDLPDLQNEPESFDSFNEAVVKVYRRLTGDVDDWKDMAEHLDDKGNEIEVMSSVLDDVLPGGSLVRPRLDEYKRNLEDAWFLIKFSGLQTISETSNTRKWEWEGLNQRCQNCPDQEYEPVYITP